ncbi:MAG: hypothetical protein ISR65_17050 [Bacteriovoracaceae bacterium]|nr:hypothetical protein [Bacteriovoracaceae bacterium]
MKTIILLITILFSTLCISAERSKSTNSKTKSYTLPKMTIKLLALDDDITVISDSAIFDTPVISPQDERPVARWPHDEL